MTKAKSKRQASTRSNSSKTVGRNTAAQPTAHKSAKLNRKNTQPAVGQQHRSSAAQNGRTESKQARIVAMLRAPSGATIDAMVDATGWQPHSVRGFLAGVVRKKLGLNLISAADESGRTYRISDHTALSVTVVKTDHAA